LRRRRDHCLDARGANVDRSHCWRDKAEGVARDVGLPRWDWRHNSGAFQFTRPFALTAIGNTLALWNREQLGLELVPGADEVSLALVADAWSRTDRSRAVTWSWSEGVTETRHGVRIRPDTIVSSWPAKHLLASTSGITPAAALDDALDRIGARYGVRTAEFVAMQLEYPTKH
jgi:hypothetical protein